METFTVRNLTFYYPQQEIPTLNDISFSIEAGQFVTVCGPSGSGKSTLLRLLKPALAPHGHILGSIDFCGSPLSELDSRDSAMRIGFVQQSVENQIVTDKVWHELAFGPESLGWDTASIRLRVAEISSFLGIDEWFHKKVTELSGGQKQLLNLAAVMVMHPEVLILDEPANRLDPVASSEFLAILKKINRELGTTVIIAEQRLEDAFPLSDRVLVTDRGRVISDGTPAETGMHLKSAAHPFFASMPAAMRIWEGAFDAAPCPVTVRDGRKLIDAFAKEHDFLPLPENAKEVKKPEPVITLNEIHFKYEKNLPDILRGVNMKINKGEIFALLGGNGAGKSTLLSVTAGLLKAYRGDLKICGSIALLPQDSKALFQKKSVREDLLSASCGDKSKSGAAVSLEEIVRLCRLEELMERHPYDLSGGEQQCLALAKILLNNPQILLLDEPTQGLDADFRQIFGRTIKSLQNRGVTIFLVSHDVEFCAEFCDRCALLFDGGIVTENSPSEFFSGNSFYTTAANRIARGHIEKAVTVADVITACGGRPNFKTGNGGGSNPNSALPAGGFDCASAGGSDCASAGGFGRAFAAGMPAYPQSRLPLPRKIAAGLSGLVMLVSLARILSVSDLSEVLKGGGLQVENGNYFMFGLLFFGLLVFAVSTRQKAPEPVRIKTEALPKRIYAAVLIILLLIPLTILAGVFLIDERKYMVVSLLILLESMVPFFLIFEGRKPQAREIVTVAVLCSVAVAGRSVFFMFPGIKPVMAVVIIAGVAFGSEAGFLTGSVSMLASNVLFGQGPWTPWQMFAMGIVGFLAGILHQNGLLYRNRLSLCVFGALSAIVIYGGIMNPAAALLWVPKLNLDTLIAYYITGLPFDVVHALSTVLFLWLGAEPLLEKLERVKIKYGLNKS
ncbi:MAG: ATP-binding cassette domain-containing protein [Clostridia bacterium]|nr:ATP-binding cassette domain-containing protein [Clostridia bacterium]